jgi:hypothetical protein
VSAPVGNDPEQPKAPPPLRTQARAFGVHWFVDSVVIFLATIIVALIFGIPWLAVLAASLALGALAARYTRRADERAMLARRES